jgi:hypothetical protein
VAGLADADRLAPAFREAGYAATPTGRTTGRLVTQATRGCGRSARGRPRLAPGGA